MSLTPGSRLGPYEILGPLGAGGMGVVYRARDTQLKRDVAIKVLPVAFAQDPERLARFQREAELLATLNHQNIAAVYGLEQAPAEAGPRTRALVMEMIEGEDLSQRIKRGPIPIDEALPIARQIALALQAAHEHGIIHRDLKPANIKIKNDGTVKVLDFGLAKAVVSESSSRAVDAMDSPTITAQGTEQGVILGTAAYMAPEQAKGRAVDRRADIWAFGTVLYEMLTGRRAFDGEDTTDVLGAVVRLEPDWDALPADVPLAIRALLQNCLIKDRRHRVADISVALYVLDKTASLTVPAALVSAAHLPPAPLWRRVALAGVIAVAGAAVATPLIWFALRPPDAAPPPVSRLQVSPSIPADLTLNMNDRAVAITPDGHRIVYIGNRGTQIFVRALDSLAPVAVFTGEPRGMFVSPDGQWIGFADGLGLLKKVAMTGGSAITLATLDTAGPSGGTWAPDDTIIFATNGAATGLQRVVAAGGPITVLTRPDRAQGEADHFWPEMLPGGQSVLFTITAITGGLDAAQVAVLDLQTGVRRVLVRGGSHAHYVSNGLGARNDRDAGHLIYSSRGAMWAVRFDLARLETSGTAVSVVPDVVTTANGGMQAAVAGNGSLAYLSGTVEGTPRTLVWVDRQSRETPIQTPPRPYLLPAVSPDGTRVAVFANDQEHDLWLWDLGRTTLTRLTFDPGLDVVQVWTPEGRRVIFTSERAGVRNLFWQAADRTGAAERLTDSPNTQYPSAVSPDGRRLIFSEETLGTGNDVMAIALDETRRVTPLVQTTFVERNGTISPDGRWLVYEANDSGVFEIYARPFPEVNSGHWQVSTTGGTRPIWARSGQELIYVSPSGALMRVGVPKGSSWSPTTPTLLIKEGYFTNPSWWGRSYDISPDGQRFLMIKEGTGDQNGSPASIVVVLNWVGELQQRVPVPE